MTFIETIVANALIIIFFLMLTNGIASAPPSESTLLSAGLLVASNTYSLNTVLAVAVFGNVLGAAALYLFGRWLGEDRITRFWPKFQRWSRLNLSPRFRRNEVLKVVKSLYVHERFVMLCVLRCAPVVRSVVSLPAGILKVPFAQFLLLTSIGCTLWALMWMLAGIYAYDLIVRAKYLSLILVILCVTLLYAFIKRFVARKINDLRDTVEDHNE